MKIVKDWVKRTPKALSLYRKAQWRLHVMMDELSTKYGSKLSRAYVQHGFHLTTPSHPAYKQMREGNFEPEETNYFLNQIEGADFLIDVGANIGYYTLLACKTGKQVIAYEPQRRNIDLLIKNLTDNEWLDRVELFPMAMSERHGIITLYGASGPSASLVQDWAGYSSTHQQHVPVSTLDSTLPPRCHGKSLLVKIDVEGAELQVISGAARLMKMSPKPVWIVEICLNEFQDGREDTFEEVFRRFWDMGYNAFTLKGELITREMVRDWVLAGKSAVGYNYVFRSPH